MKKYFAKYLPIEGVINKGDKVLVVGKYIQTCEGLHDFDGIQIDWNPEIGFATVAKSQSQKVQLFLCSRDIQVGDNVRAEYPSTLSHDVKVTKESEFTTVPHWTVEGGYEYAKNATFKVIGPISLEATWVKKGDEFEEDEVKKYWQPGGFGSETWNLVDVSILSYLLPDAAILYKIKGPCGHFH